MNISRREIERYLGCPQGADERTRDLIETCLAELEQAVTPHTVTQDVSLQILDENRLLLDGLEITSRDLARHLGRCCAAVLMAATLGPAADRLLHRCACTDMSKAVVMQSCAAAMIEAVCDGVQQRVEQEARQKGLYIRTRFSPGYGDWALSDQKHILDMLQAARRIGLTVTDSLMLAPTKSVTAVIGLSREAENCRKHKCATCSKTDCPFRQEPEQADAVQT